MNDRPSLVKATHEAKWGDWMFIYKPLSSRFQVSRFYTCAVFVATNTEMVHALTLRWCWNASVGFLSLPFWIDIFLSWKCLRVEIAWLLRCTNVHLCHPAESAADGGRAAGEKDPHSFQRLCGSGQSAGLRQASWQTLDQAVSRWQGSQTHCLWVSESVTVFWVPILIYWTQMQREEEARQKYKVHETSSLIHQSAVVRTQ